MTATADPSTQPWPPLPDWFHEYRPHQTHAILDVVQAFQDGADAVVMEAPTGSGKTLIAEAVRRVLHPERTIYTTPVIYLQRQFERDYPYARLLMGRSNYPTLQEHLFEPPLHVSCADCDVKEGVCTYCGDQPKACPYVLAREDAVHSPLAVINTSYLLAEANSVGRMSGADLIVIDEADAMEGTLMRYVELSISARRVKKYGLTPPDKVTKPEAWREWCHDAHFALKYHHIDEPDQLRASREAARIGGYLYKIASIAEALDVDDAENQWIYTGRDGEISFKPVQVAAMARKVLWPHAKKWLLMSATIVSPKTLLEDELGYEGNWASVEVASTFPPENRPVVIRPVADMGKKGREAGQWSRAREEVARIVASHPDERVLIHTVSYALANEISEAITAREVFTYTNARDRDEALDGYLATENAVLVASSMDRGVDLPDEACRVVIVAKIPYGYLGDRQVSARLYGTRGGKTWYAVNTVRVLVQMTGRGVRHDEDHCVTYIIDAGFGKLWSEHRALFPSYWRDAMRWENASC